MTDTENSALLTNRFGGWPSFYEGTLLAMTVSDDSPDGRSVELAVQVPGNVGRRDRGGPRVLERPTRVVLRFEGIGSNRSLEDVECPDTLFEIQISEVAPEDYEGCSMEVVLSMTRDGGSGFFYCERARVIEVKPLDAGESTE